MKHQGKQEKEKQGKLIITDPNGSYTGRPLDGDQPVQDADDL